MEISYKIIPSPVGQLKLVANETALVAVLWENDKPGRVRLPGQVRLNDAARNDQHPVLLETEKQLGEYFAGERTEFALPLEATGTEFQTAVWQGLRTIPYGETRSYGQLAQQVGNPKGMRAVGAANGKNPISIIVPCHRVIGSTGTLTGFAGGLDRKAYLLDIEKKKPFCISSHSEDGSFKEVFTI